MIERQQAPVPAKEPPEVIADAVAAGFNMHDGGDLPEEAAMFISHAIIGALQANGFFIGRRAAIRTEP